MKAMILAAGLGTRLRPWTLSHPKALVPVGGVPMLERVIRRLKGEGFDDIVVNVHHFAGQIVEFLQSGDFGVNISISDESDLLLDTGGGLLKALPLLDSPDDAPFLVHNVDILSDAPLDSLLKRNMESGAAATLLISNRESSRHLLFREDMGLCGWINLKTGQLRPDGFEPRPGMPEYAFSGIYGARPSMLREMAALAPGLAEKNSGKDSGGIPPFGVMEYFLSPRRSLRVEGMPVGNLDIIDIGKPDTLAKANLSLGG